MFESRCWNCNAMIPSGTICSDCKTASDWVEKYFEDGDACNDCRFCHREDDVNFSECQTDDPYDCPVLPDELNLFN